MTRENGNGNTLAGNDEIQLATDCPALHFWDIKLDKVANVRGTTKIPFLDLVTPHRELEEELFPFFEPCYGPLISWAARWCRNLNAVSHNFAGQVALHSSWIR